MGLTGAVAVTRIPGRRSAVEQGREPFQLTDGVLQFLQRDRLGAGLDGPLAVVELVLDDVSDLGGDLGFGHSGP